MVVTVGVPQTSEIEIVLVVMFPRVDEEEASVPVRATVVVMLVVLFPGNEEEASVPVGITNVV